MEVLSSSFTKNKIIPDWIIPESVGFVWFENLSEMTRRDLVSLDRPPVVNLSIQCNMIFKVISISLVKLVILSY